MPRRFLASTVGRSSGGRAAGFAGRNARNIGASIAATPMAGRSFGASRMSISQRRGITKPLTSSQRMERTLMRGQINRLPSDMSNFTSTGPPLPTNPSVSSSGRLGKWGKRAAIGGAAFAGGAWASNSGPGSTKGSQNMYQMPPGGMF